MSTYGERLQQAMNLRGAKRKDVAAAIGRTVQAVGDVLRGETIALTSENNSKAAAFLRVNPDWLAREEGQMVIEYATGAAPHPAPVHAPVASAPLRSF